MSVRKNRAQEILKEIFSDGSEAKILNALKARPPKDHPLPPRLRGSLDHSAEGVARRREQLRDQGIETDHLAGIEADPSPDDLEGVIESFIGHTRIPVGVIGPMRINGTHANGDFYVPMATSEGTLVASYQRGTQILSQAGGVTAVCLTESVSRAPYFEFQSLGEMGRFVNYVLERYDSLQEVVARTSSHCELLDMQTSIIGKEVHLNFEYNTGDASGQNMVTFATDAICNDLLAGSPVQPRRWYIEGNMSGDKKCTMQSFLYARGKKVVVEAHIPRRLIEKHIHTTPEELVRFWQASLLGSMQSGSIAVQGHVANALAAIFLACGQDVACVSEASVGLTRLDVTDDGDFYASLALPNLIVGTVGGGTHLPTTRECLEMMNCRGSGRARKFAEICAAVALAGEISICGALAAGQFAQAHASYGRKQTR